MVSEVKTVRVPQLAWYGEGELELQFPSSWDISTCYMRGHDSPRLSDNEMRNAFRHPLDSQPIKKLAHRSAEVAIIFDDMTRPTPVAQILPYVLEELNEAGVSDDHIRFIAALGAHGALNGIDFRKKLGETIGERFLVYNHNPYENCTFVGNTNRGTPVSINSEVMSCDIKIGIGCIVPHPLTGFGGGGKIMQPGVASIDTIKANHGLLMGKARESNEGSKIGLGLFEDNVLRLDIAEAARMAGLDIKIDVILNSRRDIAAMFVGEVMAVHAEGVNVAKEFYATERIDGADIVVSNAYAKANEALLAVPIGAGLLSEGGGDLVVIAHTPEGQVTHYLMRSFGKNLGGHMWRPRSHLPRGVNRLIVLSPYIDKAGADWIGPPERIIWAKTWNEVLEQLKAAHRGRPRVAVIPDATVQYFPA
ncbi:lactate racemase domain-containing protein [Chloroflexota bacterium]